MSKVKVRHSLDGKIINNGEALRVEYNPREHFYITKDLIYIDGYLYDESRKQIMAIDSVYINNITFINNNEFL
ncbi:MAG TPA: hypothetical protein GX708_20545 [Gallicola sp.]|nr:hypothetical protein [Gallicola sp.]